MRTKNRIQVNLNWKNVFPLLTRNQIILCIALLMDIDTQYFIKQIYPYGKTPRFYKDYNKIKSFNIKNINVKEKLSMEDIEPYFSIKKETLYLMFKDKIPTKQELLILFWVECLYLKRNDKDRDLLFKISDVIKEIFKDYKNPSNERQTFINTIQMFKDLKYKNEDDCLIKMYTITNGKIKITLDFKKRKKNWYKKQSNKK